MNFFAENRQENNFQIEHKTPVFQVPQIMDGTLGSLLFGIGWAAPAVYLRPTRNARFKVVANHVFIHAFLQLLVQETAVRPRPNHTHFPEKYIYELRQFVYAVFAQEFAYFGNPFIVFLR